MNSILDKVEKMAQMKKEARTKLNELVAKRNDKIVANGSRIVRRIPKLKNEQYKMLFVPANALWPVNISVNEYIKLVDATKKSYIDFKQDKSVENRRVFDKNVKDLKEAFSTVRQQLDANLRTKMPLRVERYNCVPHTAARSLASDIASVKYGGVLCNEIITVFHNTYKMIPTCRFLCDSIEDAEKLCEITAKNMLYLLQTVGIDIVEGETVTHYDFWASSSSHQKTGIAYFGESEMMQRTEFAREFGTKLGAYQDNGAEYIKRQAILFTPSVPTDVTINDILMLKDVDVERHVDNAANLNLNTAEIEYGEGDTNVTLADGQSFIIDEAIPSHQLRGLLLKSFAVQCAKIFNSIGAPETVEDIDGTERVIRSYKIIMTKSCWKGGKLGYSWSQFVEMANKIAETIPEYNKLRVVRYSDSSDEKTRFLSRQTTQQWIYATDTQLKKLVAPSVRYLKKSQKLSQQLLIESELMKNDNERSSEADAYLARPDMICSEVMQPYFEKGWEDKKISMAANKLMTRGQYPYLAHDPAAMLKILLCGADPHDESIYIVKPGEINAPNLAPGQDVYFVRYPNNFICGMVLKNHADEIYSDVGDVAILSAEGFEITRADGDFDGDEGLIVEDMNIVAMMRDVISKVNPPLILFDHAKADLHDVTLKQRRIDIAIALYNGQAYNLVGQYSNIAMKEMALEAVLSNDFMNGVGKDVIRAHVATILVIDMVKTGTFPAALKNAIAVMSSKLSNPYSQRYVDMWKGVSEEEVAKKKYNLPGVGMADRISSMIIKEAGEYEFDDEGVIFNAKSLLADVPADIKAKRIPSGVLTGEQVEWLRKFDGSQAHDWIEGLTTERVGAKELFKYFFSNMGRFAFVLDSENGTEMHDLSEQQEEYCKFVHDFMLNLGGADYWLEIPQDTRRRIVYNAFISDAFEINVGNGIGGGISDEDENGRKLLKALYARFVIKVFAKEIVEFAKPMDDIDNFSIDDALSDVKDSLVGLE